MKIKSKENPVKNNKIHDQYLSEIPKKTTQRKFRQKKNLKENSLEIFKKKKVKNNLKKINREYFSENFL